MDMIEFVSGYFVNSNGEVFSNKTGEMKKLNGSVRNGYKVIGITIDGKQQFYFAHRLVAEAFVPNPEHKPIVNHKDGNKLNNCVNNLEWCTYRENTQHAWDTGLMDSKHEKDSMDKYRKQAIEMLKNEIEKKADELRFRSEYNSLPACQKIEYGFFVKLVSVAYESGVSEEKIENSIKFVIEHMKELFYTE